MKKYRLIRWRAFFFTAYPGLARLACNPRQAKARPAGLLPVKPFRAVLDAYPGARYPRLDEIGYDFTVP